MNAKTLTKEYIESLGYSVDELADRIFVIHNFLTDDELDKILTQARSASEEEWTHHYMDGVRELAKLKFGRDDIENLVEEGLYEITHNWQDKNLQISDWDMAERINGRAQELFNFRPGLNFNGCGTIQRQYEGVPLKEHVDNHTDPSLEYAAVFYLNDDFVDGEVYFSAQQLELRPPPKSVLVFPTGDEFSHGVNAPGAGPHRYIIPTFISRNNFWEVHEDNNYELEKTLKDTE
jgi:hypothetical protein